MLEHQVQHIDCNTSARNLAGCANGRHEKYGIFDTAISGGSLDQSVLTGRRRCDKVQASENIPEDFPRVKEISTKAGWREAVVQPRSLANPIAGNPAPLRCVPVSVHHSRAANISIFVDILR